MGTLALMFQHVILSNLVNHLLLEFVSALPEHIHNGSCKLDRIFDPCDAARWHADTHSCSLQYLVA